MVGNVSLRTNEFASSSAPITVCANRASRWILAVSCLFFISTVRSSKEIAATFPNFVPSRFRRSSSPRKSVSWGVSADHHHQLRQSPSRFCDRHPSMTGPFLNRHFAQEALNFTTQTGGNLSDCF